MSTVKIRHGHREYPNALVAASTIYQIYANRHSNRLSLPELCCDLRDVLNAAQKQDEYLRALELAANGLRDAAIERLEAKREREMKPHVTGRRCANADRELSAAIDTYNALRQG